MCLYPHKFARLREGCQSELLSRGPVRTLHLHLQKNHSTKRAGEAGSQPRGIAGKERVGPRCGALGTRPLTHTVLAPTAPKFT